MVNSVLAVREMPPALLIATRSGTVSSSSLSESSINSKLTCRPARNSSAGIIAVNGFIALQAVPASELLPRIVLSASVGSQLSVAVPLLASAALVTVKSLIAP